MWHYRILLVLLTGTFISCSQDSTEEQAYLGTWKFDRIEDTLQIFTRVKNLPTDDYGFRLDEGGTIIENLPSGRCGTPPITYIVIQGSWNEISSNKLEIQTKDWAGKKALKRIEVIHVTRDRLVLHWIY